MKTAVIGLGVVGRVHRAVLEEMGTPPVLCDLDPARREGGYADWREMLRAEAPDAVHICTPHHLHAEMIRGCLEAGAHVLCEKPLCIRREEIEQILEAERRAKGILGVCLQNRYNPSSRAAARLLAGKKVTAASAFLAWKRDKTYYAADAWRGKRATEGGGVLINQALHTVDLLQWLAGMPEQVSALIGQLALGGIIETEDAAALRLTGEAVCTLYATTGAGADFPTSILFQTEDGMQLELRPDRVRADGREIPLEPPAPGVWGKPCYGSSHRLLIEDFYRCAAAGKPFPIDGREGAKSLRIVLAAFESGGRAVRP